MGAKTKQENLPVLIPLPELPEGESESVDLPNMTQDQLDAISQMNGVNQMVDDLVRGGMSYDEAYARAQQEAGITPQAVIDDTVGQAPAAAQEAEVRRATPALQNEGSFFDLSYINDFRQAYQQALQQTGDPAKAVEMVKPIAQSWSPAQRHVYERTEGYDSVDPKYAADLVQSWYKQQDQLKAPQSQLAQEKVDSMKTEKLNARRDTMRTAQMMLEAADRIDGAINNGLVGPWKNVEQAFDGSGMPFSDPDEFSERKALEVQTKRSVIDALPAFKGPLSDSDRKFFTEMFPAINEPTGVWKDYSKQLREKFQPIAEGNFDLPNTAQPQGSAQAAPTATRNTFVYDGSAYERLPDGTARLIE